MAMTRERLIDSTDLALALMRDDESDIYRQGYTFANALNAIAELVSLDRLETCIVAEAMAKAIANDPTSYSIFNPEENR